jgi:hypothetical protein
MQPAGYTPQASGSTLAKGGTFRATVKRMAMATGNGEVSTSRAD